MGEGKGREVEELLGASEGKGNRIRITRVW